MAELRVASAFIRKTPDQPNPPTKLQSQWLSVWRRTPQSEDEVSTPPPVVCGLLTCE